MDMERIPTLVLASASPRRQELLSIFSLPFAVIPARGEERPPVGAGCADTTAALAEQKAREVFERVGPGHIVIGSDTLVELDGRKLGKPRDEDEAFAMLRALSGRGHRVYSGVSVVSGDRTLTGWEETRVFFRELSDGEIRAYIRTGEPMDKAGAYGYQGRASLFVEKIECDFFNVMGLPLCRLGQMLREMGVELL